MDNSTKPFIILIALSALIFNFKSNIQTAYNHIKTRNTPIYQKGQCVKFLEYKSRTKYHTGIIASTKEEYAVWLIIQGSSKRFWMAYSEWVMEYSKGNDKFIPIECPGAVYYDHNEFVMGKE